MESWMHGRMFRTQMRWRIRRKVVGIPGEGGGGGGGGSVHQMTDLERSSGGKRWTRTR